MALCGTALYEMAPAGQFGPRHVPFGAYPVKNG
jgi:hypothetical protein